MILLRIALPYILLHFANQRLANMPGYHGHINDIDIALYRGAYRLERFHLDKVDSLTHERTPFIGADLIDLSVEWKALFKGGFVGELEIEHPLLRFTLDKTEPADVQKDTASLGDLLKDFMPLRINRLAMHDGSLEYADEGSTPPLNLALTDLQALATNLTSVVDTSDLLPAKIDATALLYGGALQFNMALDPLSRQSIFDMNLSVEGMELPKVNDFFQAYADFDVNRGTLSLYTEIATRDGAFKGYVKPIIKDLDVLGREDRKDNILRQLWEGIVGTAGAILTNPKKDQVATKVLLEGRLDDPKVRTWVAVVDLLRNAFIRALEPAIDRDINIASPLSNAEPEQKEGFLKRVFGSNKKKKGTSN
ncbi:MAG: DUF748 domain-containing protein [Flavobacteriales bacterium]